MARFGKIVEERGDKDLINELYKSMKQHFKQRELEEEKKEEEKNRQSQQESTQCSSMAADGIPTEESKLTPGADPSAIKKDEKESLHAQTVRKIR